MYTWRLRNARVFLGRRSRRSSTLLLYDSLSAAFCFCEITVCTRAMETLLKVEKPQIHATQFEFVANKGIGKQKWK